MSEPTCAEQPSGAAPQPPISVVVCTRDRPALLARCLAALARLDYPNYEVLVVDSASRGREVAGLAAERRFGYLREERPGLDRARNRGIAAARHAIIAFTDDDCEPASGWLRGIARGFAAGAICGVTGLVAPAELASEAQRMFERYSGMGKGHEARSFDGRLMDPGALLAAHHVGVGANMAFRRAALLALDGFDVALDVGTPAHGAGDIDIFHRLLAGGGHIRYEPAALVRHHHRREYAALRRQIYDNGRSFGVYLLKSYRRGSVPRVATLAFALRWLTGWVLLRCLRGLVGRLDLPLDLALAELWGALSAPWAYLARQDG